MIIGISKQHQITNFILIASVISTFFILWLSPQDTEEKPLSENETKRYRRISRFIVLLASITSKVGIKPKLPTHYFVNAECGLQAPSLILTEQIRTVDKKRLDSYIGHLSDEHMKNVDEALCISMSLDKNDYAICLQ